jgi:hypothetical protein
MPGASGAATNWWDGSTGTAVPGSDNKGGTTPVNNLGVGVLGDPGNTGFGSPQASVLGDPAVGNPTFAGGDNKSGSGYAGGGRGPARNLS